MTRSPLPLLLAIVLATAPVAAAIDKKACIASSEKAQQLRADGHLTAAREELLQCAREACPAVVRKDCARWLGEIEDALPSVVLAARDAGGHDVTSAKVWVDGKVFAEKLDGKAQTLDPGTHVFRFEADGHPTVEETVLVREGEKNRTITVTFPAPPQPDKPADGAAAVAPKASPSPAAWVLGGVGVVALGGFAYFGLSGRSRASDLRDTCAPACPSGDVDDVRNRLLLADVSLGVAVVSFGVATWLFLSPRSEAPPAHAVGVQPMLGGGAVHWVGRF